MEKWIMTKKYLTEIIMPEEVEKWEQGQIYSISAPTSTGKTIFAFNTLGAIAKKRHKKIIIFSNRILLKEQLEKNRFGKEKIIDIEMYQSIEHLQLISGALFGLKNEGEFDYHKVIDFSDYEFIIFDEAHSIFTDVFDKYRENIIDIFFTTIFRIYVLLSATIDICYNYFDIPENNKYFLKRDYSYIDNIFYYNQKNLKTILETIPFDEKAIVFVNSASRGQELKKQLPHNSEFICSKTHSCYRKSMEKVFNQIRDTEIFDTKILIATKVIDNGINIKDETIKHIFIEFVYDTDFIQALGRLRVEEQKVRLYISNISKQYLNTIRRDIKHKLYIAYDNLEFLINYDYDQKSKDEQKEIQMRYLEHNKKSDFQGMINNDGLLNKAKLHTIEYYEKQIDLINNMGYLNYIAFILFNDQNKAIDFINIEILDSKLILENSLDCFINIRMYKEKRTAFKKFLHDHSLIDLVKRSERLKSMSKGTINKCFEELGLPYELKSIQDKERKSSNYNETFWLLTKRS
jgi:superfamily II DNA or RNA helicase